MGLYGGALATASRGGQTRSGRGPRAEPVALSLPSVVLPDRSRQQRRGLGDTAQVSLVGDKVSDPYGFKVHEPRTTPRSISKRATTRHHFRGKPYFARGIRTAALEDTKFFLAVIVLLVLVRAQSAIPKIARGNSTQEGFFDEAVNSRRDHSRLSFRIS
jgi:hypothetical protein